MPRFHDSDTGAAVAALPGYVRLVLPADHSRARAACRRFSRLCAEESAPRGLIVARSSDADPVELESQIALATQEVWAGFRLAIVAQGSDAASLGRIAGTTAARRRARARLFASEHRAAAWLIG